MSKPYMSIVIQIAEADDAYNQNLAQQRCDSVGLIIESHGMKASKYVIVGEKKQEVSESGADKRGRMGINRRVEIRYSLEEIVENRIKRHRITAAIGFCA